MKRLVLLALLAAAPAFAADSIACFNQCANQGYERSYCMTFCERGSGGSGLIQQPGAPRNPYLDALPDPVSKQPPVPRVDPKCVDDCTAKGYKYQLCRKQCSY